MLKCTIMTNPLFSVVIPVYNADKYLARCLESLLEQTYQDFELVLVNDGSKDNSAKICDDFSKEFKQCKVIHQENKGVSLTRRVCVENATGDYIVWIDADDEISGNYLEEAEKIVMNNSYPDIVCFNFKKNGKEVIDPNFKDVLLNQNDIEKIIFPYLIQNVQYGYIIPAFWTKIFKRALILPYLANEKITISDDVAVVLPTIHHAKNIYLSSRSFYNYLTNSESITYSKKPRNYRDILVLYDCLIKNIDIEKFDFQMQLNRLIAHMAFNCCVSQYYGQNKKVAKEKIIEILEQPIIKEAISKIDAGSKESKLMKYALKHRRFYLMKFYSRFMMKA